MKIHTMGAAGVGATTLGESLAKVLNIKHFDSDEYYWFPTVPLYQKKRTHEEMAEALKKDLENEDSWILSGSVADWGNFIIPELDLEVFLYIPSNIRIKRLIDRENEKFGIKANLLGGNRYDDFVKFIDWAKKYETASMEMRSLVKHNDWLKKIKCPILRIEGDLSNEERLKKIHQYIK